jgi:hypothetical protein
MPSRTIAEANACLVGGYWVIYCQDGGMNDNILLKHQ